MVRSVWLVQTEYPLFHQPFQMTSFSFRLLVNMALVICFIDPILIFCVVVLVLQSLRVTFIAELKFFF